MCCSLVVRPTCHVALAKASTGQVKPRHPEFLLTAMSAVMTWMLYVAVPLIGFGKRLGLRKRMRKPGSKRPRQETRGEHVTALLHAVL